MALVTVSELKDYMDITLTNVQEDAAQLILNGLHAELETYLNRPIEVTEFTESYKVPSTWSVPSEQPLILPESPTFLLRPAYVQYLNNTPVHSVAQLTLQGPTDTAVQTLSEGTDFIVRTFGVYIFDASADDYINITYTAGLTGRPVDYFKILILRAASRETQNLHDDVVGLKDLTTRNVAPLTTGFLDTELNVAKRWKRTQA